MSASRSTSPAAPAAADPRVVAEELEAGIYQDLTAARLLTDALADDTDLDDQARTDLDQISSHLHATQLRLRRLMQRLQATAPA